jgi:pimeloyl-ACP methyl ester carboxylesterase
MDSLRKNMWRIGLAVIIVVALAIGLPWLAHERQLLPEAANSLVSDELVLVEDQPWLAFAPAEGGSDAGFVFYPGGRISPEGYSPLLRAIAAEGYLVVVPKMPLNMAPFRANIATKIMAAHPEVERWAIGGHSVGGTMAAQYTHAHSESIAGLAIWASYPSDTADLSGLDLPVVLIYGSRDPRVNDDSVAERQHLLPENSIYVRIEGGDHHQFGAYEIDPQDHLATISPAEQHEQIIRATLDLLERVSDSR